MIKVTNYSAKRKKALLTYNKLKTLVVENINSLSMYVRNIFLTYSYYNSSLYTISSKHTRLTLPIDICML